MSTPLKIDPIKLNELLSQGKRTREIADYFNCSPGAVSQAKRRLGVAVVKASAEKRRDAATKVAPMLVKNVDDVKRQLSTLIERCNNELNWIQGSVNQAVDAEYREWQTMAIKHCAEIRKLVHTLADTEYKLHHVEVVQKALLIMFEEVGRESKECQKRIRDRLERSQILFFLDD